MNRQIGMVLIVVVLVGCPSMKDASQTKEDTSPQKGESRAKDTSHVSGARRLNEGRIELDGATNGKTQTMAESAESRPNNVGDTNDVPDEGALKKHPVNWRKAAAAAAWFASKAVEGTIDEVLEDAHEGKAMKEHA